MDSPSVPLPRLLLAAPSLQGQEGELRHELAEHGVSITSVVDLRAALGAVETARVDLLLCDLTLPGGASGLELVRALRARTSSVPVLLLCERDRPLLEAADLGAFCLELPISAQDLARTVASRLAWVRHGPSRRSSRIEPPEATCSITATTAKNQFGQWLGRVVKGDRVVITRHDAPAAVLISFDEYHELSGTSEPDLRALEREFDLQMARMQEPGARRASDALFDADADELSAAALEEARRSAR